MVMLASNFLLLSALVNNVFYVSQPNNAEEMYICFDNTNDTWPSAWFGMKKVRDPPSFSVILPENVTEYKLRIIFINRTFGDSNWKNLSTCAENAPSSNPNRQEEATNFPHLTSLLIYYLTSITSFLFIKAVINLLIVARTTLRELQ